MHFNNISENHMSSPTVFSEILVAQEEFDDTKGVIRIRTSKNKRQLDGQKKKYNGQTTIYKTYT